MKPASDDIRLVVNKEQLRAEVRDDLTETLNFLTRKGDR